MFLILRSLCFLRQPTLTKKRVTLNLTSTKKVHLSGCTCRVLSINTNADSPSLVIKFNDAHEMWIDAVRMNL